MIGVLREKPNMLDLDLWPLATMLSHNHEYPSTDQIQSTHGGTTLQGVAVSLRWVLALNYGFFVPTRPASPTRCTFTAIRESVWSNLPYKNMHQGVIINQSDLPTGTLRQTQRTTRSSPHQRLLYIQLWILLTIFRSSVGLKLAFCIVNADVYCASTPPGYVQAART